MKNIYVLSKTAEGIVIPLSDEEVDQLNIMRNTSSIHIDCDTQMIKKDSYVSIIGGEHEGKYGIVTGARGGKLEVCLRSEYRDDWDLFNINDLRYLASPPEKNWKTLTAKEAVENLMAKNPRSPTINTLREQGLLEVRHFFAFHATIHLYTLLFLCHLVSSLLYEIFTLYLGNLVSSKEKPTEV